MNFYISAIGWCLHRIVRLLMLLTVSKSAAFRGACFFSIMVLTYCMGVVNPVKTYQEV